MNVCSFTEKYEAASKATLEAAKEQKILSELVSIYKIHPHGGCILREHITWLYKKAFPLAPNLL